MLPMEFSNANIPYIAVEIEGMTHHLEIDTGSKFAVSMTPTLLGHIMQKNQVGMDYWWDIAGNLYQSPTFLLPRMDLGEIVATNIRVQQEDEQFISNNTARGDDEEEEGIEDKQGTIGWPLLSQMNLLFDCRYYTMLVTNDQKRLENEGYYLDEMAKIPFELDDGIILQVGTEFGMTRALLDTGCTLNHIRSSIVQEQVCEKGVFGTPRYFSAKFLMGGQDFGKIGFHHFDFDPQMREDIILGMEFMDEHIVYLDFYNKIAYISKTE